MKAAGSRLGQYRWGPLKARRYHHYWRDTNGTWHHTELPWIAGNRPKIFTDGEDNAYLIFGARGTQHGDLDFAPACLAIAAATAASKWTDWAIIHREPGPFVNEMLGDPHRWKTNGVLSVLVQEAPKKPRESTPLRILDFTFTPSRPKAKPN